MFHCSQCGECCKHLKNSKIYVELDRGDGICRYLDQNKCSVYENRPLMCRVDEAYDRLYKDTYTQEEYYKLNYEACEWLKKNRRE